MGLLKRAKTLGYATLVLLLTLVFTLSACKRRQSPSAQEEAQNGLAQTVTPSRTLAKTSGSAQDETQNGLAQTVAQSGALPETSDDKIPLRILYVGLSNTERQEDFVSFLSQNFGEVKTADLYTFKEEQTKDCDVVILDKDGIQWGSEGGRPLRDLQVSAQYSRPTVSLGIPGAFWADRMRLKTGYM
jgi:hypothetical protein